MTTTNTYRPPLHPDPTQRGIVPPSASGIVVNTSETTAEVERLLEIRNRYTEKDVKILPLISVEEPTFTFTPWPKTPRLFRDTIITEKIDGTNAAVQIRAGQIVAQSRSRLISVEKDNFGFARWVQDNSAALIETLGEGIHYGEWWGSGIQRGYGLTNGEKRFSLFNTHRWAKVEAEGYLSAVPGLGVVPVLAINTFDTELVHSIKHQLVSEGSKAAPGFMHPEGVVLYHTASGTIYKSLIENDSAPKGKGGLSA